MLIDIIITMEIPSKFNKILKKDQSDEGLLLNVINSFEKILKDNKLFFFEEYTEHGIQHIETVLRIAEFLIPDKSFSYIKPKEVVIFILSVVLHDIGMHTYFSTFKAMLNGSYDDVRIDIFDKKTWKILWEDYLLEVRHWDSKQINDIFGNRDNKTNYYDLKEPDLSNKDNLDGTDRKIIGEFIRRNHARLAHEIALKGFISDDNSFLENSLLDERDKQLIGIIARSHGINIRKTFSYLKIIAQDAWQYPDSLNVVFFMVLLRLADYLHIDKSRTNNFLLKIKTLNSPVSLREHNIHLSIRHIHFGELKEPELIYVECDKPVDASMFTRMQKLFEDIQHELDSSWAVLGEIYGFNPKEKPKIKFRRIDSNLETLDLDYIPKNITFKMNNELSKLLIAPLYGDNPKYGVRELVQNATDACKERMRIEQNKGNVCYKPFVNVSLNKDKTQKEQYVFEIKDNGKGMTEDEILNYFLSIGSSFRQSYHWKKNYISKEGKGLITRNGKFGIGVLAAFLLGDKITVKTKCCEDNSCVYIFEATINSTHIIIKKIINNDEDDIGTTIKISMSNEKYITLTQHSRVHELTGIESFKWTNWYISETPLVQYYENGVKKQINIFTKLKCFFISRKYDKIYWGYNENEIPFIVCNDIIVTLRSRVNKYKYKYIGKYISGIVPNLIIEDKKGELPLRLDRNDLDADTLPFEEELLESICKDYITKLLTLPFSTKEVHYINKYFKPHKAEYLFLKEGFILNSNYFIKRINTNFALLKIILKDSYFYNLPFIFNKLNDCVICFVYNTRDIYDDLNAILGAYSSCILLPNDNYFDGDKNKIIRGGALDVKTEWLTEDYIVLNNKQYIKKSNVFNKNNAISIMNSFPSISAIQEIPFNIIMDEIKDEGKILNELFYKYLGGEAIIPYEINKRKNKYNNAFNELQDYM